MSDGEVDAMAAALDLPVDEFRSRHVRVVPDPSPGPSQGLPREALAEMGDGRCTLLEGRNECVVYSARPEHCRRFPYWPSVLDSKDGFERARSVCPGIAIRMHVEARREAFERMDALAHQHVQEWSLASSCEELTTTCSRSPSADDEHFVTGLEADWIAARAKAPPALAERASDKPQATCPWRDSRSGASHCRAGVVRPLACRLHAFPQAEGQRDERARRLLVELGELVEQLQWPASYGRLSEQIASRIVPARPSS